MNSVASPSALEKAAHLTDTSDDTNRSASFGNPAVSANDPEKAASSSDALSVRRVRLY